MRGSTLVELLISTAIMLAICAVVGSLVRAAHDASRVQPEIADLYQRLRVATGTLHRDLLMAGAGPYHGPPGARRGSLAWFFAPLLPYRAGRPAHDPEHGVRYREDAVTIVYVPATAAQSAIAERLTDLSVIRLSAQAGCPEDDGRCGFGQGMSGVLFDGTTAWDSFDVTAVAGPALTVTYRGLEFTHPYEAGATIVQAEWHTYYFDAALRQLRRSDGLHTDVPVADNVAAVRFTYFGTPEPPPGPLPEPGQENCLIDAAGQPKLPVLPSSEGQLIELSAAMLSDGGPGAVAWCGANGHVFDPDLLRIRRVRVRIRLQASPAAHGAVREAEAVFDVVPPNLATVR